MTLLLTSMLTLAFNIQPVKAGGMIYIRVDGSVEPLTANITSLDNVTYTFTGNNYEPIVIERDNIIVDGNGSTLHGSGNGNGFYLDGRNNVTIKNVRVQGFYEGIFVERSSHIALLNNTVSNSTMRGIHIDGSSSCNNITGNVVTNNNWDGLVLTWGSNNNIMINNTVKFNNASGIAIWGSCFNNVIINNTAYNNTINGIGCMFESFNNTISNNTVYSNSQDGKWVGPHLVLQDGKWVAPSQDPTRNNTISGNNVFSNRYAGITIFNSTYNTISDNMLSGNGAGIWSWESSHNLMSNNTVSENDWGIWLDDSSHNLILNNTISNNTNEGMTLRHNWSKPVSSTNNTLRNNTMTCNGYNFRIRGDNVSDFIHDIDTSNTVDGKPIYYLVNQKNLVINSSTFPDIGYLGLVNSTNIAVENLNLDTKNAHGVMFAYVTNSSIQNVTTSNNLVGIYVVFSCNNTMTDNLVTENEYGVYLELSKDNTIEDNKISNSSGRGFFFIDKANDNVIKGNEITNNTEGLFIGVPEWGCYNNIVTGNTIKNNYYGIELTSNSSGNLVYHNNFINNTIQASLENATNNTWDDGYPSGGNYWSDYNGTDLYNGPYQNETGSDDIGDTPYVIDEDNQDNYPVMNPWTLTETSIKVKGKDYPVTIVSNTTIDHIVGTINTFHFRSSGPAGEKGYINVIFPIVNTTELKVFIDGDKLTPPPFPVINTNGTHYFIYFEFNLSTHEIAIQYGIIGDVNENGEVDILDVKLVKLAYSGWIEEPNADIDNNGVINILDLKKVKLAYSGFLQ